MQTATARSLPPRTAARPKTQYTAPGVSQIRDIVFTDATHGWAVGVGWGSQGGMILATTDGGTTWHQQPVSAGLWEWFYSVDFVDARHGWAVGQDGIIAATTDGGATWKRQSAPISYAIDLEQVDFVNTKRGWTAGESWGANGIILATKDGGSTWLAQRLPNSVK